MLAKLLNTKKLFPSTQDVLNALKDYFRCSLDYEDYRRRGRAPAIRKCLAHLAHMRHEHATELLSRFFQAVFGGPAPGSDYRELFRILTQHE